MRKPYRSDLTDQQWELIRDLLPAAKPGGRPRTVDLREVVNTLMYQARTGCQWDYLPHDLAPKSTVWDYFVAWQNDGTWQRILDALRGQIRKEAGHATDTNELIVCTGNLHGADMLKGVKDLPTILIDWLRQTLLGERPTEATVTPPPPAKTPASRK